MTAAQAASMSTLRHPIAASPDRTAQHDAGAPGDGAWQRALETATRDAPQANSTSEASYLLALGNLGAAPVESLTLAPLCQPLEPDSASAWRRPDRVAAAHQSLVHAFSDARTAADAKTSAAHETGSMVVASPEAVATATQHGPSAQRGYHLPESRLAEATATATATDHPASSALPRNAFPAAAVHGITAYSAAMSAANVAIEREADFAIVPRATSVPVRVHVQWRGRVADVWIGLHRQAFDQLPDIRAGVQDWVAARGGVLGHVVCNGETLSRVCPSIDFQGAL